MAILLPHVTFAQGTERVEFDTASGNYLVEYFNEDIGQVHLVVEPPNKIDAVVRGKVTRVVDGRFHYEYELNSSSSSRQAVNHIRLPVPPGVSKDDVMGPADWRNTFAELRQEAWWSATRSPAHGIVPGTSQNGFGLVALSLPSIVRSILEGWTGEDQYGGVIAFPGEPTTAVAEAINAIRRDPSKWGKPTDIVGPIAAPKTFDPVQFTNHLLDLKNQSVTLGWIKDTTASEELGGKLSAISGQLSALTDNKIPLSKGTKILELGAQFLQFVESNSCKDFECAESRPLTAESYALLFYNMDYFLSQVRKACEQPAQLPPPIPSPAPKRKK